MADRSETRRWTALERDAETDALPDDRRQRPGDEECYRILSSRDARFDGRFFFGVTTTGIYCRPICPARTPHRRHVRIFPCAAAAAEAGFRPCLRCRPESSPGTPAWSGTRASVTRALRLIDEGALDGTSVGQLAARLGLGERQLRRLFDRHLGASPVAVAQTRRVHFAKRLLDDTDWSMTEIAHGAGFSSLRRFNTAIRDAYGCAPRDLRRRRRSMPRPTGSGRLCLRAAYRRPFDFGALLSFLEVRAIPGVERVADGIYRRCVRTAEGPAVIELRDDPPDSALRLSLPASAASPIADWVARARRLCDLAADPAAIASVLGPDPLVGPRLRARPGLRVPGAWDGFEVAIRIVLGQQVSVRGATTLAGRLVEKWGEPLVAPAEGVTHAFPAPEILADADLGSIGLPAARARALGELARRVAGGTLDLDGSSPSEAVRAQLREIPGVGPWTVEMIALRALGDPDAFPAGDLGLRRALAAETSGTAGALPSERRVQERSLAWRPWRSTAAMALWSDAVSKSLAGRPADQPAAGEIRAARDSTQRR